MVRQASAVAVLLSVLALTPACGAEADVLGAGDSTAGTGTTETKTIEVTLEGDTSTPAGARVGVAVGQRVDLVVTADRPGEIHVHSSPEQTFAFDAGTNAPIELSIDRPGLVEVEFHEPVEATIVELEVQ